MKGRRVFKEVYKREAEGVVGSIREGDCEKTDICINTTSHRWSATVDATTVKKKQQQMSLTEKEKINLFAVN